MLHPSASKLGSGDNCSRTGSVEQRCRARLPQHHCERGLGQQNLCPGTRRADPQNLAHIATKQSAGLVNEMAHIVHPSLDGRTRKKTRRVSLLGVSPGRVTMVTAGASSRVDSDDRIACKAVG